MNKLKLKAGQPTCGVSAVRETQVSGMVSSGHVMISRKEGSVLQSSNRFSVNRPSTSEVPQSNRIIEKNVAAERLRIFGGDDNMSDMMDTEFELIDHQRKQLLRESLDNHRLWAKRKRSRIELRQILQGMRSQRLSRFFITRMKRNAAYVQPLNEDSYVVQSSKDCKIESAQPSIMLEIEEILFLIILWIFLPVGITFSHLTHSIGYILLQIVALIYTLARLSSLIKIEMNKYWYWRFDMIIKLFWLTKKELLIILSLLLDLICANSSTKYLSLIVLLYCPETLRKVKNLQKKWFTFVFWYKYGLILKTFLLDFFFAHYLCCLVIILRNIQFSTNWTINHAEHINNSFKDYLINYQWALSNILSCGFKTGDPNFLEEAVFLMAVQVFSCGLFLYNLIKILKYYTRKTSKTNNFVERQIIINKLKQENLLSYDTLNEVKQKLRSQDIIQAIQQPYLEELVIKELPSDLQNKIKIERNSQSLNNLLYFKHLTKQTVQKLAQSVEIYISYPGELIKNFQVSYDIFLLKKGIMNFVCMKNVNTVSDTQASQRIEANQGGKLEVLGLQYLSRQLPKYGLISTSYATLLTLKEEDLSQIFRESRLPLDIEYWSMLRDKCQNHNEFQVLSCPNCHEYHTKFDCPKLHYIPYRSIVLAKEQHKQRKTKLFRVNSFQRIIFKKSSALTNLYFKEINKKKKQNKIAHKKYPDISVEIRNNEKDNDFMIKKELNNFHHEMVTFKNEIAESIIAYKSKFRWTDIDEVWSLKSDILKDYRHYFPNSNPSNIACRWQK